MDAFEYLSLLPLTLDGAHEQTESFDLHVDPSSGISHARET
jgi:hypothetical protein